MVSELGLLEKMTFSFWFFLYQEKTKEILELL